MRSAAIVTLIVGIAASAGLRSDAQVVTEYSYDAHGRLLASVRGSLTTRTTYLHDPADNRLRVKQGNSAPVAIDDFVYEYFLGPIPISPLVNDTDDDFPFDELTITSLSGTHFYLASIDLGGQSVSFSAPGSGSYNFVYHIEDAGGATSSASIWITIF